ncbi:RNA polymerase sigma factor [Sphingobacterium faecale]|uniref:RNA polymerase sigma-70 factor n=1 Tax=Sphingobacterium faecale TaxID=2803775 RepID=A0ABS1R5U9_9SPHI|nr:RNA polymerase sigma-70 factor [Sphingobacterium faecale]MBL1410043.1 RNA polymerase sigma-70 factor [Sphingobacterium faecale]
MSQRNADDQKESELLIQLKEGDEKAFREIYELYSIPILRRLNSLLKDREVAKEVLQDIFLKFWEKRVEININRSLRAYLYQIAENRVVDFSRRARLDSKFLNHIIYLTTELQRDTEQAIDFKESSAILDNAIDKLPPRRKEVFKLCKIEGKSYEEVAQLLGISIGSVNDHMVKALRSIRKYLTDNDVLLMLLIADIFRYLK